MEAEPAGGIRETSGLCVATAGHAPSLGTRTQDAPQQVPSVTSCILCYINSKHMHDVHYIMCYVNTCNVYTHVHCAINSTRVHCAVSCANCPVFLSSDKRIFELPKKYAFV